MFSFIDLLTAAANFVAQIKLPSCEKYAAKISAKIKHAVNNGVDAKNAISKISEFYWDIDNAELGASLAEAVFGDAEFYDNYNKQLLDYRAYCGGDIFKQIAEVENFCFILSKTNKVLLMMQKLRKMLLTCILATYLIIKIKTKYANTKH